MYKYVLMSFVAANLVRVITTIEDIFTDWPPSFSKWTKLDSALPSDLSKVFDEDPFFSKASQPGGFFKEPGNKVQMTTTFKRNSTISYSVNDSPPLSHSSLTQFEERRESPNEIYRGQGIQLPPSFRKKFTEFPTDLSKIFDDDPFFSKASQPGGFFKEPEEIHQVRFSPTPAPPRPTPSQVSRRKEAISSAHRDTNFSPKGGLSPKDNGGYVCGRPILTNSLINNGEAVPRGAYPWLGALYRIRPSGFSYTCSASLISHRHVITAAHCVKNQYNQVLKPQELVIILGKHNLQIWARRTEGEKMIEPESISVHPDYRESSADADIAVLVLSESVQFSKYVLPLCIWRGDTGLQDIVGMEGVVAGWGSDLNGVLMTDEPKQTNLPIVSQETCLRSSFEFLHITSNRTFCAGFRNGNGPCNGDSGSGFIMKRNGRWTLRGVVSLSLRDGSTRSCDLSNYVVFTDASKYLDWLISFIE